MRNRVVGAVLAFGLAVLGVQRGVVAQGFVCAEGGGSLARSDWGQPVLGWMVAKVADGVGKVKPRVAILGAAGDNAPPEPGTAAPPETAPDRLGQKFIEAGCSGVEDLRINAANADLQETYDRITRCQIVFIRGGGQNDYVRDWKGKKTEAAVREVFRRGGVVGGTSAGCAVLGEVVYDAFGGSCGPGDALRDARTGRISLTTGFLEFVPGVLFDTHFTERGRLGRLPVMMAHAKQDLKRDVIGVGMDTRTAFCVSPDGTAEVIGQGSATILRLLPASRMMIEKGKPPVVTDIEYTQLLSGQKYDIKGRRVIEGPGRLDESARRERDAMAGGRAFSAMTLDGGDIDDSRVGQAHLPIPELARLLIDGDLSLSDGRNRLPGCIVATRSFDVQEFAEVRVGGVQWAMTRHPGLLGVYLMRGNTVEVDPRGELRVRGPGVKDSDGSVGAVPASAVFLEAAGVVATGVGASKHAPESKGPRQSAALEGLTLHVLAPGWAYDARGRRVVAPGGGK